MIKLICKYCLLLPSEGVVKAKILFFWSFKKNISITTLDIAMTFCMTNLHIDFEGSMSHFFLYLGPSFDFM